MNKSKFAHDAEDVKYLEVTRADDVAAEDEVMTSDDLAAVEEWLRAAEDEQRAEDAATRP